MRPRIWSANLDGTNPAILTDEVLWPVGITCDVPNQRLYWTDAKHRTVYSMTLTGQDIRTVHTFTGKHLIGPIDIRLNQL